MSKILQYSEMECNCARKITERLFREYSTLWQHNYESPMIMSKILYTLDGGPLTFEALDQSSKPIGKSGTGYCLSTSHSNQISNVSVEVWSPKIIW